MTRLLDWLFEQFIKLVLWLDPADPTDKRLARIAKRTVGGDAKETLKMKPTL